MATQTNQDKTASGTVWHRGGFITGLCSGIAIGLPAGFIADVKGDSQILLWVLVTIALGLGSISGILLNRLFTPKGDADR